MARKANTRIRLVDESDVHLKPTNALKIRIDDLKTFDPLTNNQKLFFDNSFNISWQTCLSLFSYHLNLG